MLGMKSLPVMCVSNLQASRCLDVDFALQVFSITGAVPFLLSFLQGLAFSILKFHYPVTSLLSVTGSTVPMMYRGTLSLNKSLIFVIIHNKKQNQTVFVK